MTFVRFISDRALVLGDTGQVETSRLALCLRGDYRVMQRLVIHLGCSGRASHGLGDSM
jgi:hypothetical protein